MMLHSCRRRFLTFMEMMVVLAIISLIGGIVAINVSKAMAEQRFRTEVSAVVNQLRLAQNLMLILDQDISVKFLEDKDGKSINYWLEMQCPAVRGWDKELTRRPPPLKSIHVVDFDADASEPNTHGELELRFMSGGVVMSRGVLRLSTAEHLQEKGAFERYICLPGYPAPISAASGEVPDVSCLEEINGEFENQITQVIVQEITTIFQAAKAKKPPTLPGQSATVPETPQPT